MEVPGVSVRASSRCQVLRSGALIRGARCFGQVLRSGPHRGAYPRRLSEVPGASVRCPHRGARRFGHEPQRGARRFGQGASARALTRCQALRSGVSRPGLSRCQALRSGASRPGSLWALGDAADRSRDEPCGCRRPYRPYGRRSPDRSRTAAGVVGPAPPGELSAMIDILTLLFGLFSGAQRRPVPSEVPIRGARRFGQGLAFVNREGAAE